MDKKNFTLGALLTLAMIFGAQLAWREFGGSRQRSDSDTRGSSKGAPTGMLEPGVRARTADPAAPRYEFSTGGTDRERLRQLASGPQDIKTLLGEWAPTRVSLEDNRRFDVIDRCREKLGWASGVEHKCAFMMTSVLDTNGRVVYVRVEETSEESDECSAIASCMTEARLNETVVLPESYDGELAVRQTMLTKPLSADFDDLSFVNDQIALLQSDLEAAEAMRTTPDLEYRRLLEINLIGHLQARAARIREAEVEAE